MNEIVYDSKLNEMLELKSEDGFCFYYEPVYECREGKQKMYKIMDGLYFFIVDITGLSNSERVNKKIEDSFDKDVIAIYHCIEGEASLQLSNYYGRLIGGESFYFVGNSKFVKSKFFNDRNYTLGFIAYTEIIDALLIEFKCSKNVDINILLDSLLKIHKPFIMKTGADIFLLIKILLKYIEDNNYYMIKNKAFELLYLSINQYEKFIKNTPRYNNGLIETVSQIKKDIDLNYKDKIIIGELLKKYSINKTYFYEIFNYQYGISPYKYITKLRLENSYTLLLDTDLSVEKISYICGYDSTNKFIKQFKKEYGKTPGKIKKLNI